MPCAVHCRSIAHAAAHSNRASNPPISKNKILDCDFFKLTIAFKALGTNPDHAGTSIAHYSKIRHAAANRLIRICIYQTDIGILIINFKSAIRLLMLGSRGAASGVQA
jgi:hypothetical protein